MYQPHLVPLPLLVSIKCQLYECQSPPPLFYGQLLHFYPSQLERGLRPTDSHPARPSRKSNNTNESLGYFIHVMIDAQSHQFFFFLHIYINTERERETVDYSRIEGPRFRRADDPHVNAFCLSPDSRLVRETMTACCITDNTTPGLHQPNKPSSQQNDLYHLNYKILYQSNADYLFHFFYQLKYDISHGFNDIEWEKK